MGKLISALNLTKIELHKIELHENWKNIGVFGKDNQLKKKLISELLQNGEMRTLEFREPSTSTQAIELVITDTISVVFIDLHRCPEILNDNEFSHRVSLLCDRGRTIAKRVIISAPDPTLGNKETQLNRNRCQILNNLVFRLTSRIEPKEIEQYEQYLGYPSLVTNKLIDLQPHQWLLEDLSKQKLEMTFTDVTENSSILKMRRIFDPHQPEICHYLA